GVYDQIPGTSILSQTVSVNQGLFSVTIPVPTGVDWQNITPYLQVSVNGQVLQPVEPVTSTMFSVVSASVVDGAISQSKIAAGAVGHAQLAAGSVQSDTIQAGAVGHDQLAGGAVQSDTIQSGAVGNGQIQGQAVTLDKLASGIQLQLIPAGTILPYAGPTPGQSIPAGWLLCDGKPYARVGTYGNLFTAIGTVWGPGDGVNSFNVPDLRGRTPIGAGQGAGLTNRNLGTTTGEEMHTLSVGEIPAHSHTVDDNGHTHSMVAPNSKGVLAVQNGGPDQGLSGGGPGGGSWAMTDTQRATTGITLENTGGGQPHNNMQPSAVVNFIIKY
ncbi:MAG TPA: tail fiber protein, partial [Elusimicrobiota bacterium]|nr:tail fiber protein [Elusimicrobiota bacterium]